MGKREIERARQKGRALMSSSLDRRQISVLFFDLVEASSLSERLDPEDLRDVLNGFLEGCEAVVRRHGGHVAQRLGDGLLVYFGYPVAMEDDARRAVLAALEALRETRRRAQDFHVTAGRTIQARIGIHTGPVVLEDLGRPGHPHVLAIGETPNKAARVQAAAHPDTVLVSEPTYRLTKGYFTFADRGLEPLKGFSEPIRLYKVVEPTGVRSRLDAAGPTNLTPFVDREEPMAALLDKWGEARAGGAPVVLLSGDAGIGKSRLVHVFRTRIEADGALFIRCFCSSFLQNTALWPVADMLNRQFADAADDPLRKLERLSEEMRTLGVSDDDSLSLVASLLGLPMADGSPRPAITSQRERQATFRVLSTWLARLASRSPVLFVVEDLHWSDPSTLEFLSAVFEARPEGPLMVLLTHRPEFVAPWQGPRICRLPIGKLDRGHSEEILKLLASDDILSEDVADKVLLRADGVPLFLEEITKAVIETSGNEPARMAQGLAIPSTLQESLMARLDRLGPGKAVAQLAATIGRMFTLELLAAVSDLSEAALRAELDGLVATELVYRRPGTLKETYIFKHALIQDAAYGSLLRKVKQQYHLRIVEALSTKFAEIARSQPELLAHHYAGAGRSRDAIDQWLVAGQRAMARSAFNEAADIFSRALRELPLLPSEDRDKIEIELRSGLGLALISTRGWAVPEVEQNYSRTRQLCESFGSVPVHILYAVWGVHLVRADLEGAFSVASMFRELSARTDDPLTHVAAHTVWGALAFFSNRNTEAMRDFLSVRAWVRSSDRLAGAFNVRGQEYGLDAYLYSELYMALCLANVGSVSEAEASWRATLEWVETTMHPYLIATVLAYGATLAQAVGNVEWTMDLAKRLAQLSAEHGFHYWLALAQCTGGWAVAESGSPSDGMFEIEQGLTTLRHLGALLVFPHYCSLLIEACIAHGRIDRAGELVDEALNVIKGRLGGNHEPRLLRLKGDILARAGRAQEAVPLLRRSIELADAGRANLILIDAAHSLARIVREGDPAQEARTRLRGTLDQLTDAATHRRFSIARDLLAQDRRGR